MTKRLLFVSSLAVILVAALSPLSAAETPTEEIAACVENAWDANSECQTDDSWLNDVPCAIKFEADVILCSGAIF